MSENLPLPLKVTLVQTSLEWQQPSLNRQQLAQKMQAVADQTDLIVLPEMFTSGFTGEQETLKENQTTQWMLEQASKLNAAVTGSVAWRLDDTAPDKPTFVNRLLFVTPNGEVHHYDKVHLFRMGDEHLRYQPGNQRLVIPYKGWRLFLTVCYDLRFPVFCRTKGDYDLMVNVANWPEPRRNHWRTLLQARAIENQSYVVGVNRVGTDGRDWHYSGDSMAVNYLGEPMVDKPGEWVETVVLDFAALEKYRKVFPAWMDADDFDIQLKQ